MTVYTSEYISINICKDTYSQMKDSLLKRPTLSKDLMDFALIVGLRDTKKPKCHNLRGIVVIFTRAYRPSSPKTTVVEYKVN
jgi:hypothetical protein